MKSSKTIKGCMPVLGILLLALFLSFTMFSVNAYARPDVPVVIVNDADSPVPVTMTGACKKTVVSGCVEQVVQNEDYTVMTVPADKVFILTDIVGTTYGSAPSLYFWVLENDTKKLNVRFSFYTGFKDDEIDTLHLNSGVPFGPGSSVVIHVTNTGGTVLISGYLVDN